MTLLELFDHFVKSKSPPDILSIEFNKDNEPVTRLEWFNGTVIDLPYSGHVYDKLWVKFQQF